MIFALISTLYAEPTNQSNADIFDEDMADITDWTDNDAGYGASTQATFDSKSCMQLSTGIFVGIAKRYIDAGSFGSRTIFSMNIYCDNIGSSVSANQYMFSAGNGSIALNVYFGSDGLFIRNNLTLTEVGSDILTQDVWQEWTFDMNWTAQTVDVYLNGALQGSDFDCSGNTGASIKTDGLLILTQNGAVSPYNFLTYIDWFKVGDNFILQPYAFTL